MANVPDTKKVATLINVAAAQLLIIRNAMTALKAVRTAYIGAAPSLTGTPLVAADVTAISASITALDAQAALAVWDKVIAAQVPSHTSDSLA